MTQTSQQEADDMLQKFWEDRALRRRITRAHEKFCAPLGYSELTADMVGARVIVWNASGKFERRAKPGLRKKYF